MTVAARNTEPPVTDGADVRMRVRGRETAPVVPIRPDLGQRSAYTRAIPRGDQPGKSNKPGKIRNVMSPHVEGVKANNDFAWLARELPDTLGQVARTVLPAKGEHPAALVPPIVAARVFKLAAHLLGYLLCFATATDKRAAVALALTLLTISTTLAVTTLAGH